MTEANTTCHKIRKGLIEELGEAIDTAWFSQVKIRESKDQQILDVKLYT